MRLEMVPLICNVVSFDRSTHVQQYPPKLLEIRVSSQIPKCGQDIKTVAYPQTT